MENFVVSATRMNTLAAKSTTRGHDVLSGEPTEVGGGNEGMNPHELVLAGLASCTIITCQMYANRKNWPLEATNVIAEILSVTDGKATISRKVSFIGSQLTDEQRARLLDIANKCPVHKMLSHASDIQTTLV